LGAELTIQPRKKVIVKKPQKGVARARLVMWSHMMIICIMSAEWFLQPHLDDVEKEYKT
jgi:hypothetical protein